MNYTLQEEGKSPSHSEFYPSKTQAYHCLVRKDQSKFGKDMKFLPSKVCITQHKPFSRNFEIRKLKDTMRKYPLERYGNYMKTK